MSPHNQTLHKQGLARRKEIRKMLNGRNMADVARELGISRERVRQLVNGTKPGK